MRKLKLQVQITVDGFIAGPGGEMDWVAFNWSDDLKKYVGALTEPIDTIVLGRKLAEGFIPHWASRPAGEDLASIDKFNNTAKVVFTRTLQTTEWENTRLAKGDLATEINNLKRQPGGDIIAYGGATFVSSLIKEGLIDEFYLFVNPVAIGSGMAIFRGLDAKQNLTLVESTAFACGIVGLHYQPKRD
ncbi:MAG: dihydrofolate reductase family protein [Cytophagales bacterium]|nr:dihydrofolate reductase family protein [Cytophagales bacterium]